ncbi:MAG: asparagine synthase (glutamine-hydrolyzing) [Fimbriimonadaceae bacterium]|nr:asparagine synthase (glutamine-hydrolyzing) [Fimbriimonadaceae bacterium]
MCGFAGLLRLDGAPPDPTVLARMNAVIEHRGPDDGAVAIDGPCGLANRRLAILDLRPEAALPMRRGAAVLAYNGVFYSYQEARQRLAAAGHEFTTSGDSEVLLALHREHGEGFCEHLRGMFAFAIWDSARQELLLGRDPAGKKPLYWYADGQQVVFGSEIKSLLQVPGVPRRPRLDLLPLLLAYGYVPSPETAFEGIQMLPPGQLLVIRADGSQRVARSFGVRLTCSSGDGDPQLWSEQLLAALRDAVRLRLISDVPLGAFLSGGLDSSLIVALMRELVSGPLQTFSIGFASDASWDETAHAETVARLFETVHQSFRVDPPQVAALLPELVWYHDQPFGDSSAIPTLLLCRLARPHVTVALNGDAGDELFAGYERFKAARLAHQLGALRGLAGLLAAVAGRVPQGIGYRDTIRRAWEFADGARRPLPDAYFRWVRIATDESLAALCQGPLSPDPRALFRTHFSPGDTRDWVSRILDVNYRTYLHDDLLIKSDRMSMAASLEVRSPFLDSAVVQLASALPTGLKLRGGSTKWILKEAARRLLPDRIIDRPKHGFGVPLGDWFRGSLRGYAEELLLDRQATSRGWLRAAGVQQVLAEHVAGRRNHGHLLWTLCTIEQWFRLFIDPATLSRP